MRSKKPYRRRLSTALAGIIIFAANAQADELEENSLLINEGYAETFVQGTNEIVGYQIIEGLAIMEGDIMLGEHSYVQIYGIPDFTLDLSDSSSETLSWSGRGSWPQGVVPYTFEKALPSRYLPAIRKAMEWFEAAANIRFVERTDQPDYIEFYSGAGCHSNVGRAGGRQKISIGSPGCAKVGVIAHEIFHALGFWHEQSRSDRDHYITVHWDNVQRGKVHNFYMNGHPGSKQSAYDYYSILHFRPDAYSVNGLATIVPVDPKVKLDDLGQRKRLSALDILRLQSIYGDDTADETELAGTTLGENVDSSSVRNALYILDEASEATAGKAATEGSARF